MGNAVTTNGQTSTMNSRRSRSTLNSRKTTRAPTIPLPNEQHGPSRGLFLLYLLNRTWNAVVDGSNTGNKERRRPTAHTPMDDDFRAHQSNDEGFETDMNITDIDDQDSSLYGSQYSFCSCSFCYEAKRRHSSGATRISSYCDSDFSYNFILQQPHHMAPSAGKIPPETQRNSETTDMSLSWNINNTKDINQRPPVFNPEDYIQSLKKYGRRPAGAKSIYDTSDDNCNDDGTQAAATLPSKNKQNSIRAPPENDSEMSLRQFGSITDLLTKLRADLRASFPSFVQEFVASPLDGTTILLEVLRSVQLSQTLTGNGTTSSPSSLQKNTQSYQRRALLDELACLQCLSVCVARSPEAGARLGTTTVGLLPLAASATGQGIRSRIISLQLLTAACDKTAIGNGTQKNITKGHSAVSEALSTLRLRCGEPVRFRLLVGMLNSGGGTGEFQAVGLRFVNTFLESSDTTQTRLYLQAELFQAGFDPSTMTKTIASSSPWLEKLRSEVKRWEEKKIDIGRLQVQARESEKLRNQLVVLERRCLILHEEKSVLTSMERRLQERCAELQREVFRLQGKRSDIQINDTIENRPKALPRQVPPQNKVDVSEHDDEGISSSETGPSMSPEPERAFPKENAQPRCDSCSIDQEDGNTTIDDVIEELKNIVSDAEREISIQEFGLPKAPHPSEHVIVPENLLPQPPRKSRSLVHLLSNPSEADGSDYGLLLIQDNSKMTFFDEGEYCSEQNSTPKVYIDDVKHEPYYNDDSVVSDSNQKDSNRAILNVIMDAREKDTLPQNLHHSASFPNCGDPIQTSQPPQPPQHFNGVFFMTDMNNAQRYPKPDISTALEAKRVTKNLDRMESYGLDSMVDIVFTSDKSRTNFHASKSPPLKFRPQYGGAAGMYSGGGSAAMIPTREQSNRTVSNTTGSKLTDLPSGLY